MKIHHNVLPNGLNVVTVPTKSPSVSVGVWVKAGGRDEPKRINGISHFIEHLVFKGTKKYSVTQIKESIEGKGGMLNAFTSEECTCFYAKVLPAQFKTTLQVLSEMVLRPTFASQDIQKERRVVIEEIRMVQDQPNQYAEEMAHEIFFKGHPIGRPLTGTFESMQNINRKDLLTYWKNLYTANRITVVACGDAKHQEVLRLSKDLFSYLPKVEPMRVQPFVAAQHTKPLQVHRKKIKQSHLALVCPGLSRLAAQRYDLSVLNVILGGNMSSRLFNEVREERGLAYEIGSNFKQFQETGALFIEAGIETRKVDQAFKSILEECHLLGTRRVPPAELKRAKDYLIGQFKIGFENTLEVMHWVGEEALFSPGLRRPQHFIEGVLKVSGNSIRDLAQQIFVPQRLRAVLVGPLLKSHELKINKYLLK
jgi:predicted Zn-dependent peptidase